MTTATAGARHVVLVGMMATGKTTVGEVVAETLGRTVIDSDDQIEARTGRSVREIWRADGEAAFRRMESDALAVALASSPAAVISAAGGVVLDPANRAALIDSDAVVVWLRARPDTLFARVRAADDEHRPLLDDDPGGTLERMHDERGPLYEEVATTVIDVDDRTPDAVAAEIVAAVSS